MAATHSIQTAAPQPDPSLPYSPEAPVIATHDLSLWYGRNRALNGVSIKIPRNQVTALIGPSGCGKSSLLRCFNRMNDLIDQVRVTGRCEIGGQDILHPGLDVIELRKRVGMVFQKSNPFPKSIFDNVAYALRLHGLRDQKVLAETVERSLRAAARQLPAARAFAARSRGWRKSAPRARRRPSAARGSSAVSTSAASNDANASEARPSVSASSPRRTRAETQATQVSSTSGRTRRTPRRLPWLELARPMTERGRDDRPGAR